MVAHKVKATNVKSLNIRNMSKDISVDNDTLYIGCRKTSYFNHPKQWQGLADNH